MKKLMLVLLMVTFCGVVFADSTYKIDSGKAVITETMTDVPVTAMGPNNQQIKIPATDAITRTYQPMDQATVGMQIAQLAQQKAQMTAAYNSQVTKIDASVALLKKIDADLSNPGNVGGQ